MSTQPITSRRRATAVATIATMLILAIVAGAGLGSIITNAKADDSRVPTTSTGLTVTSQGDLRDFVDESHQADFDTYMADESHRATFLEAFQDGVDGTTAGATTTGGTGVRSVLAYGFDRDHVWVTLSYADVARGAITVAVSYCKSRVPAFICTAAGNWLKSLAQGYAPLASHGVWGALYWNRYTGGRW